MPQYFDEQPMVDSRPSSFTLAVDGRQVVLTTDRGVFSHARLDAGTAVLLRKASPPPDRGDVLDLGCGYGPIAMALAVRAPHATVWAVDVNERALELARANADANGLANVRVARPGDVPAGLTFDALYSNPPVRVGKQAMRELLDVWLPRLRDAAAAELVVQRHLGADSLHSWLEAEGYHVERVGSSKGYRVLQVRRP